MSMHPERNLFKEFPNKIFVETGSYRGDGIQLALDAGFERIVSIDIDPENTAFCQCRFDLINFPEKSIHLITGDSAACLWDAIKNIEEPITFWLDSHWQMLEGTDPGNNPFPLLDELYQIRKHSRKDHTIIIDDLLYMTHRDVTGVTLTHLTDRIYGVNPDYTIEYFANPVINNILVAHV